MLLDPAKPIRTRFLSFIGLIITLLLIYLGAIWPSLFTIIAFLAIPSPLLFAALILYPKVIERWPKLRFYLFACVILSVFSWIYEIGWLIFNGNPWTPPWEK